VEQLMLTRQALCDLWPAPPPDPEPGPRAHLFVGAPGVGKTTCLLKWLAQAVLLGSQPARVRRLDGPVANMAESLSVFGEILGVPVERGSPDEAPLSGDELLFLDVPGVAAADTGELERMHRRLQEVDNLEIHLVLNAAYESSALQAHARAFSRLPLRDLIVTHLDEEGRWGKLWNLVLGTNYTIRFLSSGQNIPGEFQVATAERMVSRLFH
jgi:flagellar biosynthesis protein FlhF